MATVGHIELPRSGGPFIEAGPVPLEPRGSIPLLLHIARDHITSAISSEFLLFNHRISVDTQSGTLRFSAKQQINWRSPVEKVARWKWHVRGNWNPREDRTPSLVWLGIFWIGMLLGFGLDAKHFLGKHPPLLLHLHAAVFTIWMFLITAQVLLVVRNRVDLHRKFGWFLAAWACLMGVMGPVALYTSTMMDVKAHGVGPDPFMCVEILSISSFLILLAIGFSLRKNSAAHKRMMILSCAAIAAPGFARLMEYLQPTFPSTPLHFLFYIYYGNILLVLLMLGWDLIRGRLVRVHVIASVTLLTCLCLNSFLFFWKPWSDLTLQWVTAWAK